MKIMMIGEYHELPGGGEIWENELVKFLVKHGIHIDTFYIRTPVKESQLMTYAYRFFLLLKLTMSIRKEVEKYDLIQVSKLFSPLLFKLIYKRKPVVAIVHNVYRMKYSIRSKGLITGVIRGIVEILSYRLAPVEAFIVPSEEVKNKLINLGIDKDRILVLGAVIDIDTIDSVIVPKSSEPEIIYLGRLIPSKHPEHAILLSYSLGIKLHIVGEGPLKSQLILLARKIGANVIFHGFLSGIDKYKILKRCWLLVLPSVEEGLPLSVLEAMASKVPVAAYDIDCLKNIIKDGFNGILAKDYRELKEKIFNLLKNKQQLMLMSNRCRKKIIEEYVGYGLVKKVKRIYYHIIK